MTLTKKEQSSRMYDRISVKIYQIRKKIQVMKDKEDMLLELRSHYKKRQLKWWKMA